MVVAFSCTKNWYHYLIIDIFSLIKTNRNNIKKIYLFLETDNINDVKYLKDIVNEYNIPIKIINFNNEIDKYINIESPNYNNKFTLFSLSRLFLSNYIDEDKVLYIDVDAIVVGDISYIKNIDINDFYVAGVKDHGVIDGEPEHFIELDLDGKYINSGFILLNLNKIREDKLINKFSKLLNDNKYRYPDQDILNIVCGKKIKYIHSMYNYIVDVDGYFVTLEVKDLTKVKVFHYAGMKNPWLEDRLYGEAWYDKESDFYNFINNKEANDD